MAGSTLAIALYLAGSTVAWLAVRWICGLGGREGMGGTRETKCAVEANSGLAIAGGETEGGSTPQTCRNSFTEAVRKCEFVRDELGMIFLQNL